MYERTPKSPMSLQDLLYPLKPGSRILDLGCDKGTFRYSDFPALSVHAVDEAIPDTVRGFPPNATFIRARASAIPQSDEAFDLVIVNFAFEHFPDARTALQEIQRVAKDGAYVWMSMPNAASFEDQLYRNMFAGGGHLQWPSFERFLRLVYQNTCLKLISYIELPAGYTFLGESEPLRHLTWAVVDALKRSAGADLSAKSGYIFVLRKASESGTGFLEASRTCSFCGSPDGDRSVQGEEASKGFGGKWTCPSCGAVHSHPATLQEVRLDDVERAQMLQWEKLPETRPARLRELITERTEWALALQRELDQLRKEFDRRGEELSALRQRLPALERWPQFLKLQLRRVRRRLR